MNRAERRKMMKESPEYRKAIKDETKKAMEDLKAAFRKHWQKLDDDETANDGKSGFDDSGDDEKYNY